MKTKQALCNAMNLAAGNTNRVRQLLAISKEISAATFERLSGQHPSTMERDLDWAQRDFQTAKADYEAHCKEIGVPAYATWSED